MQAPDDYNANCIRLKEERELHDETNLDHFQNERRVLKIIFQRKVNLSDVLAGLGIVDVHVDHWHASILRGKNRENI